MDINTIEKTKISSWITNYKNIFKEKYSEVFTPFSIAQEMINFIPDKILLNENMKYLDAGCGCGNISLVLYKILYEDFHHNKDNILNNMITLLDINDKRTSLIKEKYPFKNIYTINFLTYKPLCKYDVIICNPPFIIDKYTIWHDFLKKCMECLKPKGFLCILTPSIWMKPEHKIYNYITSFKIHKIKCLNNNESNKIFNGDARTPICYMLIEKVESNNTIEIFDNMLNKFIEFKLSDYPIPMYYIEIMNKIIKNIKKYGSLKNKLIKTNCIKKKIEISEIKNDIYKYENVKTCILKKISPLLIINYSNIPSEYYNKRKVILGNKMYGIPYYDKNGTYGISTRDNYLYIDDNDLNCTKIFQYLNTKLIMFIYQCTRYRMCYLEKYAFELIPNILNIKIDKIDDINIYKQFELNDGEIYYIEKFFEKTRIKNFKIDI